MGRTFTLVAERSKPHLRAVKAGKIRSREGRSGPVDLSGLAGRIGALDERLADHDGIAGLSREVAGLAEASAGISSAELEGARAEIKAVIDKLLKINGELQSLLEVKRSLRRGGGDAAGNDE